MDASERAAHIRNLQHQGQQLGTWLTQLCLLGLFPDVESTIEDSITLKKLKGGNTPDLENKSISDSGEILYEMGVPDEINDRPLNSIDVEEFTAIGRNYTEHLDDEFIDMVQQQVSTEDELGRRIQAMDVLFAQMRNNVEYVTRHYQLDSKTGGNADIPMFRISMRAMDLKPQNKPAVQPHLIVTCDKALAGITESVRVKRFTSADMDHASGSGMPDIVEHTPTSTYLIYRNEPNTRADTFLNEQVERETIEDRARNENAERQQLFEASDKPNNIKQPESPNIPEHAPGEPGEGGAEAEPETPDDELRKHNLTGFGKG